MAWRDGDAQPPRPVPSRTPITTDEHEREGDLADEQRPAPGAAAALRPPPRRSSPPCTEPGSPGRGRQLLPAWRRLARQSRVKIAYMAASLGSLRRSPSAIPSRIAAAPPASSCSYSKPLVLQLDSYPGRAVQTPR